MTLTASLIVPVLEDSDVALASLEAIAESVGDGGIDFEVVLAAAQPSDEAAEALFASLQGDVRIVRSDGELNLAQALNRGAGEASGEIVMLLEPGVGPDAGWLEALVAGVAAADVVGSVLATPDGRLARGPFGFRERFGDLFFYPLYEGVAATDPVVGRLRECRGVAGGAIALRRAAFERLGGFEEGLDGHYLWLDLALRAAEAGLRVAAAGRAVMRTGTPLALTPMKEFTCGERFRERWNGRVKPDLLGSYADDGFKLAGTGSGGGNPEKIMLRHPATGQIIDVSGLNGPWPRRMLDVLGERTVLSRPDGSPGWGVPEAGIDREGDLASHYELTCAGGDAVGAHQVLLDLVGSGKRVLELGCASGFFSRHLHARGCAVTGVEIDETAAAEARTVIERVIVGDLDAMALEASLGGHFEPGSFDVVVAGDVLEHLRDPEAVLRSLRPLLAEGGAIVASVPNVTHGSLRLALLAGQWRYRSLGLLDRTHVRFFTRWGLGETLSRAGYRIEQLRATLGALDGVEVSTPFEILPPGVVEWVQAQPDAEVYQFVFRAVKV